MDIKTKKRTAQSRAIRRNSSQSVYVDSSAFIAFLDQSDTYHTIFAQAFARPPNLITATPVMIETHGWFLRRYDAQRALQFLNFIQELPRLEILAYDTKAHDAATIFLRKYSDQPLTLVDASGLSIISERKIKICWSTDRHLSLTGASLLISVSS